jgi:2-polyprenyl-3-methyl-5-hydroxy-6-metoxy-1,4-benzoquinol methylase
MIRKILRTLVDIESDTSLITKQRLRRIALFKERISSIKKPLKILDVGGTELFWEKMGFAGDDNYSITILNLSSIETHFSNLRSVIGDARDMHEFRDGEFDIVFSNSVIEHVGDYADQRQMAKEVQRVGKRYFLQTPNFFFLLEPHFLFPFFQFFPLGLKVFLLRHFNLGWYEKVKDREEAIQIAKSIRLLKRSELLELFPGASIHGEKIFWLTNAFIVYKGL